MDEHTLTKRMPRYYQTSKVISSLNRAAAAELSGLETKLDAVFRQFFTSLADTSLDRWEEELGLPVNRSEAIQTRRARIQSKLRGQGTVTVRMLKNVAESFANAESEVVEVPEEARFTIRFVGAKGVPPNLEALRAAVEDCKPAHLAFDFAFTYNTWGMVSGWTWGQVAAETWEGIRTR